MSVNRTVTLHGIRVPLRTELSDGELDAAVGLVRQRMDQVADGVTHREPAVVAALTALNLAGELLVTRSEESGAGALDLLSRRIEDHLKRQEAGAGRAGVPQRNAPADANPL